MGEASRRLRASALAGALVAVSLCLLLAAASASAAPSHAFLFSFEGAETPAGSFAPAGVAVDASSGDIYVADRAHDVVDRFDAEGHYLSQLDGAETSAGFLAFSLGAGLAVDNSGGSAAGDLYVLAAGQNEEQAFTPPASGEYTLGFEGQTTAPIAAAATAREVQEQLELLSTVGANNVAVSEAGGEVVVLFQSALGRRNVPQITAAGGSPTPVVSTLAQGAPGAVYRFGPTGAYLGPVGGTFSLSAKADPQGVSVDAEGNVWVIAGPDPDVVAEFSSGGQKLAEFLANSIGGEGLAVDSKDNLYAPDAAGVHKIGSTGGDLGHLDTAAFAHMGLAADLATDHLFVLYRKREDEQVASSRITEFSPAGNELLQFGQTQLAGDTQEFALSGAGSL